MNGQTEKQNHSVSVQMRKEMSIGGVRSVESFDENEVILKTLCGEMTVEGERLHIGVLDTEQRGVVTLSGRIDAVIYTDDDSEQKKGIFAKIFR